MILGDVCSKGPTFRSYFLIAMLRISIGVGTMAAAFYNQTKRERRVTSQLLQSLT